MSAELLQAILAELQSSSEDIDGAAVLSPDGQLLASRWPASMQNEKTASMSAAALLSLSERAIQALARGELEQVMVKGSQGYVLLTRAGPRGVLLLLCQTQARLGMLLLQLQRAADQLERVL